MNTLTHVRFSALVVLEAEVFQTLVNFIGESDRAV